MQLSERAEPLRVGREVASFHLQQIGQQWGKERYIRKPDFLMVVLTCSAIRTIILIMAFNLMTSCGRVY